MEFPILTDQSSEAEDVCTTIINTKITHLVFLDHRLHPSQIISLLIQKTQSLPNLVLHIYGDFFLNGLAWYKANNYLKKFKTHFLCASSAQTNLVKKFLKINSQNISTIPFPVHAQFNFSEAKRDELRSIKTFKSNDFVLCYAGRISLQKNVLDVISSFAFISELIPESKLMIAGSFDDIGIPYLSSSRLPLTMETEFFTMLKNLPENIREKINYLGELNQQQLSELFLSSDAYISYSTHNDEDFGMAPAEALCCGLPLFLTRWGGFMDFKENCNDQVELNEVRINENIIKPLPGIKRNLFNFVSKKQINNFKKNSITANNKYSIKAVSNQIQEVLEAPQVKFQGFNSYFANLSKIPSSKLVFRNKKNGFDAKYIELYDCYLNKGEYEASL
jgi:glycosyltransferase involved in cell wall biosynthesis